MRTIPRKTLWIGLLWAWALTPVLQAYTFGKNKIQYRQFHWRIAETPHFRLFYYEGGESLAEFAAGVLESTYTRYSRQLDHQIREKTPVILYNAHKDFQQTNVILSDIEEGVGGFTEQLKRRVVVPFTGSYREFAHVLAHELVHVFQYDIWFQNLQNPLSLATSLRIPLWVIEGSAEYFSEGWSPEAEAYVRDLVFNDQLVPPSRLGEYGGYLIYKEGEAFFQFLAQAYGPRKASEFFHQLKVRGSLSGAVEKTLGMDLATLDETFELFYKKQVYPLVARLDIPQKEQRITNHQREGGFLNVGPALSPNGVYVAFISDRHGYSDIYLASVSTGRIEAKLVSGQKTPDLEYLHLLKPGLTFSPDGKTLAFTAQGGPTDLLHLVDVEQRKIVRSIRIPELDAMYTPAFAPDSHTIALVGLKNGASDIYLYDIDSGTLRPITQDRFDDLDPSFTPDGRYIVFASDRNPDSLAFGAYAAFAYDLETDTLLRLTPYFEDLRFPHLLGDTAVAFLGLYEGTPNLLLFRRTDRRTFSLTRYLTGLREVSINRRFVAFSLLWKGGYDIFVRRWADLTPQPFEADTLPAFHRFPSPPSDLLSRSVRYTPEFTLDWLAGGMAYTSPFGVYGALTLSLSDALGNHRIFFTSDLYQDLENSDLELLYLYLPRRYDLGLDLYQQWEIYFFDADHVLLEQNRGALGLVYFPLNRFFRLEGGLGLRRPHQYFFVYDPTVGDYLLTASRTILVTELYTGAVFDNVLYTYFGNPLDGTRWFTGFAAELGTYRWQTVLGDYRRYFRLGRRSLIATRLKLGKAWGRDALPFWIGGAETLRGYSYYQVMGTNLALLNLELRVPFIDRLRLAFPVNLELGPLRGVLFADIGNAWYPGEPLPDGIPGIKLKGLPTRLVQGGRLMLLSSVGMGLRIPLGFFYIKLDAAKRTDFTHLSRETWYHLTLGQDF